PEGRMNDLTVSTGVTQTFPEALQSLLDLAFDRTYLAQMSATGGAQDLPRLEGPAGNGPEPEDVAAHPLAWRRVVQLPVQPAPGADDFLLLRWQRMLTTLHAWQRRFVVVLLRTGERPDQLDAERGSRTELFFGTRSLDNRRD